MIVSLQARVVFPVDRPPIERGVVTIDGKRIVAVGTMAEGDETVDLGNVALLPGLVNTHTHLEFSYLRKPLGKPGMPLVDWIRLVIGERGRANRSTIDSFQHGVRESLECGVTTIGDIVTSVPGGLSGCDVTAFAEIIGYSRVRADSAFNHLTDQLDCLMQAANESAGIEPAQSQIGISPHAPYTVSPSLLKRVIRLAFERGLPVAMHVAESPDELELLGSASGPFRDLLEERSMWDAESIPRGSRPLDYLRMISDAPRVLAIHGNYLDDEELAFLGARRDRMSLVYCPRTHAYFEHPPYPLDRALAAGVRVALGTDSRASNPDLSLLEEMRHVAKSHPQVDPAHILSMGTLSGAEALGRSGEVGSITVGKRANLVAVPVRDNERAKPEEILQAILADDVAPSSVYLAGRRL
ncbi:MAG TPA: amidohydrolase family protein [Lacipirellulaceae bacterium]|nr:amidohydrolase family protein [Lacipirellulaceae bacterium]